MIAIRRRNNATTTAVAMALSLAHCGLLAAQQPQPPSEPLGDAARGQRLYADTYHCYACHGFDAQSGERRLVPMKYTQEAFIHFVQNSPLPQMPPFPDASTQVLADIYAYLRTVPLDAPALASLPPLRDIWLRKQQALGASGHPPRSGVPDPQSKDPRNPGQK